MSAYEVLYSTTRLARVSAIGAESAKRTFAAYILYDDVAGIESDVTYGACDDASVSPAFDSAPTAGSREEMRDWLERADASSEAFEVGLYEDPSRALDPYLRLLATNDPWRLEGHGSLGRTLSGTRVHGDLETFDGRVRYRFDATQFLDYVRLDVVTSIDPARPHESIRLESLVDVSALHDGDLRQIASSYEAIASEHRLTARFAGTPVLVHPFAVTFEAAGWAAYVAHRLEEPERFLPPPTWSTSYPQFGGGDKT